VPAAANPGVAFEPVEIDVTFSSEQFTIPAHPASVWLPILTDAETDALDIIPGLLYDEDQDRFDELIFANGLDAEELKQVIYELIGEASGHKWWWTLNLLSVLRGANSTQWLGEMTRYNATQMSLGGWCNALYAMLMKYQKPEDRMKIDMELEMPPPDVELEISEADQRATETAFFGMMRGR